MVENTVTDRRVVRHTANGDSMLRDTEVAVYNTAEPSRPLDRVRWGAVFAGLATALSTLVVLGVLGLAIGLTTYETGDRLSNFGIGAGIWGAVSTFVAFILGGWVAARSAAVRGRSNALLNGAMVWAIAIPLIMYLLSSGVGSVMNMATDVAAAGATALADVTPADVDATANAAQQRAAQVDSATINEAVQNASGGAWGTLIALLLGLAAATIGGLMGERKQSELLT